MSDCRGCDGTCCTGIGSQPCSCLPREDDQTMQDPGPALAGLLEALGGRRKVRQPDGSYVSQCPAHDDGHPSLLLREFRGATLIRCHVGCSVDEVLAALNMSTADLFNHAK